MLAGETILTGAKATCDCGTPLPFKVCCSAAGFYIGTECDACGPWSRESHYFESETDAEEALRRYEETGDDFAMRDTGFHLGGDG